MQRRHFMTLAAAAALPWSLSGCDKPQTKLKTGVNAWIGYAPLVYAEARGWLDTLSAQLYTTVSLGETLFLFEDGQVDTFCATQYEYHLARHNAPSLVPVMLLDRSNGGDGIVANRTLAQLKTETRPIEVYLEADSINRELFEQFVQLEGLGDKTFRLHNQDQQSNTLLDPKRSAPMVVVTYSPYMERLLEKGFVMLANTRDMPLLVVDALFTLRDTFNQHRPVFEQMKKVLDRSIEDFRQRPEKVFPWVSAFLGINSVNELRQAMAGIEWINHPDPLLLQRVRRLDMPVDTILL